MSLFPAYDSSSTKKDTKENDQVGRQQPVTIENQPATTSVWTQQQSTSVFDWLRNDSFVSVAVSGERQPSQQLIAISSSSSSSSSDSVIDLDSDVEYVSTEKKLAVEKSNKKAPPLGAVFMEDVKIASVLPTIEEQGDPSKYFRLDRSQNQSLLKFNSIYEGHLSKYAPLSRTVAVCRKKRHRDGCFEWRQQDKLIQSVTKKQQKELKKKKEKRYFQKAVLKKLSQSSNLSCFDMTQETKKMKLSLMDSAPLEIKLSLDTALDESPSVPSFSVEFASKHQQPFETPYDELKKASIRQKSEEFNRRLNTETKNVQLWLDFVDFQNEFINSPSLSDGMKMTEQQLLEKKLSILDKALQENPGNVQLLIEKIKLKGHSGANQDAVAEEWKNIAFAHPNNAEVWWECILAVCRRFSSFSMDRMLLLFSKCLSTMGDILDGTIRSHKPTPNMEEYLICMQ